MPKDLNHLISKSFLLSLQTKVLYSDVYGSCEFTFTEIVFQQLSKVWAIKLSNFDFAASKSNFTLPQHLINKIMRK